MNLIARAMLFAGIAMLLAGAIGCTQIPPPTPLSQLNEQQMRGHDIYQQQCARCHSDRTNDASQAMPLRGVFKKQYLDSGAPANDDRVMDVMLFGRGMMPAVGRNISPQDRDDLLAYLHTL